jgi:hypothetical protein
MLDGGSDEHCACLSFGDHVPLEPSTVKLRDVQRDLWKSQARGNLLFSLRDAFPGTAVFQTGPSVSKNLLSVGNSMTWV